MFWIRIAVLSIAFVSVAGQCTCEASTRDGYTCMKELADYYTLHWRVDDESVSMAMAAQGAEWVGVSFAEKEDSMEPADAVIGWIGPDGINIKPYRITAKSVSEGDVDDSVTLSTIKANQENDDTTVEFIRTLKGGKVKIDVDAENTLINYAIGDEDDLLYHGINRGQTTICLAAVPDDDAAKEEESDEPEEEDMKSEEPEEDDVTGCTCLASDDGAYTCMKKLADYFTLHWKYEDDSIAMAMVTTNAEWASVAFAEKEHSMEPADAVIGWIGSDGIDIKPYRITAKSVSEGDVDDSVTLSTIKANQRNDDTTVEFVRKLKGGSVKIDVNDEATIINFAIGDMDDLVYHGRTNRGHTTICIAAKPVEAEEEADGEEEEEGTDADAPALPPDAFFSEGAEEVSDLLDLDVDV